MSAPPSPDDIATLAVPAPVGEATAAGGTTVVVGAAQGIGAEIAARLSRESWTSRLVLADLKAGACSEAASRLERDGLVVEAQGVDITDPAEVAALVSASPGVNRVAIAAGAFAPGAALEVERETFAGIIDVNLVGVFFCAQAFAAEMADNGGGAIVGIASIAARMPRMRQAAYCASKAGMRQGLRVLGMELAGAGVRINTVSPGATDTPMMRALAADHASVDDLARGTIEAMRPRIPSGRVARTADVAGAVAYLLGPDAGHVFLQDLVIDGGELLGM